MYQNMDARHRHDETLGRTTPERDASDNDVPKQAGSPIHFDACDRSRAKTPTERDGEIELPKQGSRQAVDDFIKRQEELAKINRNVQTDASVPRQNYKLVPCISKRPRERKQTKRTSCTYKKRRNEPTFEEVELCHSSKSRKVISDTPETRINEQQFAPQMEKQQLFEKPDDQQVSELQRNRLFDSESDSDREDPMNNEKARLEEDRLEKERLKKKRFEKKRLVEHRHEEDPLEEDRLEEDRPEEDSLEEDRLEEDRFEKDRLEEDPLEEDRPEEDPLEEDPLEEDRPEEDSLEEDRLKEDRLEEDRFEKDRLEEDPLEEDRLEEDSFEENRLKEDRLEEDGFEGKRFGGERFEEERPEEERESEVHGYGGLGPETETPKKRGRGRPRKDQKGVGASAPRSAIQLQKHWDLEDQAILAILKKHNSPFLKLSV